MGGSTDVTAVADPNLVLDNRETVLNFSAGGGVNQSIQMFQEGLPFVPFIFGQNYNSGESILEEINGILELIVNPDFDENYILNLFVLKSIDSSKFKVTLKNGSSVTLNYPSNQTTQKFKTIQTPPQKGEDYNKWNVYYDNVLILIVTFLAS